MQRFSFFSMLGIFIVHEAMGIFYLSSILRQGVLFCEATRSALILISFSFSRSSEVVPGNGASEMLI